MRLPTSEALAGSASAPASAAAQRAPRGTRFPLTIIGYNYTRRSIGAFSVNYAGGANLPIGLYGGGDSCCGSWVEGDPLPTQFKVEWIANSCEVPIDPQEPPRRIKRIRDQWRSEWVDFHGPVPAKPYYLEAHFYPDGKVEIAITEQSSEPRVRVDPTTISRDLPLCTDTK